MDELCMCGAVNPEGARFCAQCGRAFGVAEKAQSSGLTPLQKGLIWGSLLAVVLFYGVFFLVRRQNAPPAIQGMQAGYISEPWARTLGVPFSGPRAFRSFYVTHGEKTDPRTGVRVLCDIYHGERGEVYWAEVYVGGRGDALYRAAQLYLGALASTPYTDGQPSRAREWVLQHIASAPQGERQTQIGTVRFVLGGTDQARYLEMQHEGLDRWTDGLRDR